MLDKKPKYLIGTIIAIAASVVLFAGAGWLFLNRQFVADQVVVWAYKAPANVQQLEKNVAFTDKGKFAFYATQPEVASADSFNTSCPRQETASPILGCYASGRIYVYNITNEQLKGIEEVTAAHETLHAIWDRMSASEQARLGKLLEAAYAKVGDAQLKERMDYYARTEPGQFHNELHSILGTEVADLGSELNAYYDQYFINRQVVVAFHQQYSSVFNGLQDQANSLLEELKTLGESISSRTDQYNKDIAVLSSDIQAFNSKASSNSFSSMSEFNRERAALVARSNQLERQRLAINSDVDTYRQKYDQYEAVASQLESLNKSIDSFEKLTPTPSL